MNALRRLRGYWRPSGSQFGRQTVLISAFGAGLTVFHVTDGGKWVVWAVFHAVALISGVPAGDAAAHGQENAQSLFRVTEIPSDNQICNLLDPINPACMGELFWWTLAQLSPLHVSLLTVKGIALF